MIYTSCFGSQAPAERKICIARKCPKSWGCRPRILELAPENPWAKGDWRARYREELALRFPRPEDLRSVLARAESMAKNPILCCYEVESDQCHRRVLAEVVMERIGFELPEWTGVVQGSLL